VDSMDQAFREHSQMVFRYLLSLGADSDQAEELTQETFYQAVKSAERFDGSCKLSTWLCAIARNKLFEDRRRHPPTGEIPEDLPGDGSPEEALSEEAGRLAILRAIHAQPESVREVLHLRLLGNLSFRQIGEVLGKSEEWARVTFYRAKLKLREELREHD